MTQSRTEPDIVLQARGLQRRFVIDKPIFGPVTEVRAVDGVDLQIRRGETFAIVGESGCGKSTLARLLVRLIDPTEGEVMYDGKDISRLDARQVRALRRDLQFIFQDPFSSLNPRMTVGALIEEPLRAHGLGTRKQRREKVEALLSRVGLMPEHANRYPHEFSGGQRQRVGIARALASGPKVLIGDEPVSALDVSIQAQVVNILEDLKDEFGLTLVVIAHDLAVIRHMADRVAVMYLGQIVEIAPVADLFRTPLHPYSETLIAAIPVPRVGATRATSKVEGDLPNPISPPSGCRFHPRCPYAVDRCASQVPGLTDIGQGRSVACHRHAELTLDGLAADTGARTTAAEKRFENYRNARAGRATR